MTTTNPNAQAIKDAVSEIVVHLDRIASEREAIKDILKDMKDRFEANPKAIRKVATAIHKGKAGEVRESSSELVDLIEEIVGYSD